MQPNTLVRFRGMIHDMLGNEFYAGAYKVCVLYVMVSSTKDVLNFGLSINLVIFYSVKDDVYLLLLLLGCQRYLNMITLDCNVGSRTKPID